MACTYKSVVFDGPAGVGKSTIAKAVAMELGFSYVDTGAMYRAVTLFALENGITLDESGQTEMLTLLDKGDFRFVFDKQRLNIYHGSRDITEDIRSLEVTNNVSYVAALPEIRAGLRDQQRKIASCTDVVMEGRDIGTVVLPNATYKFFLTASSGIRARRRYEEMAAKGISISLGGIKEEIETRDRLDSSRTHAPLRKAENAIEIDTSELSIPEVKALILSYIK